MTLLSGIGDTDDIISRLAERYDPTPNEYAGHPVQWVSEVAKEHTTADQQAIMNSVAANRYTAVQACHGVGKSYSAARLVAWWLDTHPPGEAFVVTTAPTAAQVETILWREIAKVHRKAELFGRITSGNNPMWKADHGPDSASEIVAIGRKPADHDPSAFQGIHARYVLIVIDEACGVPKLLFDAVDSLATNMHARVLAIGNPDSPSSHFAVICKPGSGWNVLRIDALTQATFTLDEVMAYPKVLEYMLRQGIQPSTEPLPPALHEDLVTPLWVDERIRRWGIDSPTFQSKVRGVFPKVSIDTLIHPDWVLKAQMREAYRAKGDSKMGVDVARYGKNHTIIMLRQGGWIRAVHDIAYGPTTQTAGLVQQTGNDVVRETSGLLPCAFVDDAGVGGGVTDLLGENGYPHVAIQPGAAGVQKLPNGTPRFYNLRSELMWNLREALAGPSETGDDGWLDIDPLDEEFAAQLSNIKYEITSKGQIKVESKDAMEARGVESPDRVDAACYSLAPDEVKQRLETGAMITGDLIDRKW